MRGFEEFGFHSPEQLFRYSLVAGERNRLAVHLAVPLRRSDDDSQPFIRAFIGEGGSLATFRVDPIREAFAVTNGESCIPRYWRGRLLAEDIGHR